MAKLQGLKKRGPTLALAAFFILLGVALSLILLWDAPIKERSKWAMVDLLLLGCTGAALYLRLFPYRWEPEDEEDTFIIGEGHGGDGSETPEAAAQGPADPAEIESGAIESAEIESVESEQSAQGTAP